MSNNRRIKISLGRTINDGNYGSYRADVSYETDINDDNDLEEAYSDVEDMLLLELDRAIYKISHRDT